jgi:hypothetical protein
MEFHVVSFDLIFSSFLLAHTYTVLWLRVTAVMKFYGILLYVYGLRLSYLV